MSDSPSLNVLRGVLRLLLLTPLIVLLPVFILMIGIGALFGTRGRYAVSMALIAFWSRLISWMMGLRVVVRGRRHPDSRLFVGNHVSYLDILVSGSAIGGVFVSRHDVKDWPVMGIFARISGTIFLDRSSLRSAIASAKGMVDKMHQGAHITLFPEGGTTEGGRVDSFKPFLFNTVAGSDVMVQPFVILYTHIAGQPTTLANRDFAYWYNPDEPFLPHAWKVLQLRSITAQFHFLPPLPSPASADKVVLRSYAESVQQRVAALVPPFPVTEQSL
ncbi:MAG: 1-acyl-sn-glycerol-3-phosphate acyltransferase [Chlorobi bacterium]|nr:1-acyl-sn-glycerol-3-phosphate acyltransferase [Chlorobiota bacterium]